MAILGIIGPLLEVSQGSIRPFFIYVTGVIFGAMLSQQMAPEKYLVGASGGVYALALGHVANVILNADIMDKRTLCMRLVMCTVIVGLVTSEVTISLRKYLDPNSNESVNVSIAAHLGGALTGVLFGTKRFQQFFGIFVVKTTVFKFFYCNVKKLQDTALGTANVVRIRFLLWLDVRFVMTIIENI